MEHWETTIEAGNRCFASGDWVAARELYLQALAEAQLMYTRWPDHDRAIAAFVISHHNLADLQLTLGHPGESVKHLCTSHECLLCTATDESQPDGIRSAALRHCKRTYLELLHFITRYGSSPRTDGLLAAFRQSVERPTAQRLDRPRDDLSAVLESTDQ